MIDEDCKNFNVQNDFLYYSDDKMGLNYIQWNDNAFGRGNSQYMLEPYQQYNYHSKSDRILAQLEVSVTLVVKMKYMDKPLIYNRIYLPEINCIGVWDGGDDIKSESYFKTTNFEKQLNEINAKIESHQNFLPQQEETALYQHQKMRIKKLCEFWIERANSGEDPFQKIAKGL